MIRSEFGGVPINSLRFDSVAVEQAQVTDGVMTVADSPNSPNGSHARGDAAAHPSGRSAKPAPDVTDLLIMNTLDPGTTRSPAEAPGTNDLLDAMVQDHLERAVPDAEGAAGGENAAPEDLGTEEVVSAGPPGEDLSGEQRTEMLQREIEMLLAGTPVADAPKEPGTQEPASSVAAGISQAELDVLVPNGQDAGGQMPGNAGMLPTEMPQAHDEAEQQISDAEGVLAEELSQLLAETKDAEGGAAKEKPEVASEGPVSGTSELVGAAAAAEQVASPPEPVQTKPPEQTPGVGMMIDDNAGASAGVSQTAPVAENSGERPAGVPEHPVVELLDHSHEDADTDTEPSGGILADIGLMLAQLFDIPFAWINQVDKNVIGVIAFLLLMGGIVFWIVGWAIGAQ